MFMRVSGSGENQFRKMNSTKRPRLDYSLAHKCVFVFNVHRRKYALKFLLFPRYTYLGACDEGNGGLRGCFVWGPTPRYLAGALFLGELHLATDVIDMEVIAHEAYHVAHKVWLTQTRSEEDCAELLGLIIAADCHELRSLEHRVPVIIVGENILRCEDRWPGVQYKNRLFDFTPIPQGR